MSHADEPFFDSAHEAEPGAEPRTQSRETPHRFRRWRRARPFWGGLISLIAGLEIAFIPLTAFRIMLVSHNVAIAAVTGAVIAILGVLLWVTPSQNKLYGLIIVLLGVVSFVTSNIGGFLLGGLLAIVGGALGFAWVVVGTEPVPAQAAGTPEVQEGQEPQPS